MDNEGDYLATNGPIEMAKCEFCGESCEDCECEDCDG